MKDNQGMQHNTQMNTVGLVLGGGTMLLLSPLLPAFLLIYLIDKVKTEESENRT